MELCGGTHVEDLSKIYPFKILSEGSVAAGEFSLQLVPKLSVCHRDNCGNMILTLLAIVHLVIMNE